MKPIHALVLLVALAANTPVLSQKTSAPSSSKPSSEMPLVDGEVLKVDAARGLVVLKHGDLPNLAMPPMTMGFEVAEKAMLTDIKVGDKVRFQAEMRNGKATVTEVMPRR
jgi:Cu(I)/Ag(I) efflux system membrane protein CusA/SilA